MSALSDRQMLEAAIAADFDDVAAHSAYADLLIEEGDPGRYIQIRMALENRDQSPTVAGVGRAGESTSRQYQQDWFGKLARSCSDRVRRSANRPNIEYTLCRGWLTEIDVQDVRDASQGPGGPVKPGCPDLTLRNTLLRTTTCSTPPRPVFGSQSSHRGRGSLRSTADGSQAAELVRRCPAFDTWRSGETSVGGPCSPPHFPTASCRRLPTDLAGPSLKNRSFTALDRLWLDRLHFADVRRGPNDAPVEANPRRCGPFRPHSSPGSGS